MRHRGHLNSKKVALRFSASTSEFWVSVTIFWIEWIELRTGDGLVIFISQLNRAIPYVCAKICRCKYCCLKILLRQF